MAVGTFAEPAVMLVLLIGGTLLNRNKPEIESKPDQTWGGSSRRLSSPQTSRPESIAHRRRELRFLGWRKTISSCKTEGFQGNWLSKVLRTFPFLIEVLYWGLIYWVYQLGRAITAVTLVESTIHVARRHAMELIRLEQRLGIFWELPIQAFFLARPDVLHWINCIYSYVHIPASVLFLISLYYVTTARGRLDGRATEGSWIGPTLYEARRRTMAMCNLLAFLIFTLWPCMPPRLLADSSHKNSPGTEARSHGFIDTVHGAGEEGSVWTQNRFCNQLAAMPSLHFGYSLLIGLTVATIPLPRRARRCAALPLSCRWRLRLPSLSRLVCVVSGLSYIALIFVAIISTANHFILDAIAGAAVVALGWFCNEGLLNLLPLEDFIFGCLRAHKPERLGKENSDEATAVSHHLEDVISTLGDV